MSPPLTLTSLLNSLHTHLQSQTQLLPTLHAQLGLPPTALADELTNLQHQLMQSVETQIEARRKEVEEWLLKCEEIESACIRYSKALGGNIKATGSSVGELRKEQILPKRYEMVSEYQEKLRQLYHTKLEQLSTLTNRLNGLYRTLGSNFYSPDILEPTPANGEDANDATANRDVTPERFSKLEKELVRGKGEVSKRLSQLSATMVQIDWLYTELGISPPSLDDLPTSSSTSLTVPTLPRPSSSCSTTNPDPFAASVSTPTPSSRGGKPPTPLFLATADDGEVAYQRIFARFVARLEEADSESLPEGSIVGLESVDPSPGLIAWAHATHGALEDTKRRREAHIQAMYDQLEGLWRRLGVADADMDAFVEAHRGSTEETVKEYEEELERMLELKRERMGTFVGNARDEIGRLWDELMVGEEERADFAPFFDDEHTEELLTIHEDEIKRLKDERRMKAPLLAGIRKYFEICEEEKELAAAASDQTRLLGRGPRDPGRLLREEKMRKRVSKEKPRLEQDLLTSIPAWEDEAGTPFLVHGESILRILMDTVSAADQENKRKGPGQGRAGSVPPRATTPLNAYVPGKSTGVVTPAVRPGSSMANSSNKRPRLGESVSSLHTNQSYGNTPSYGGPRAPLGASRGQSVNAGSNGHRSTSPMKTGGVNGKTPGSSLPRPIAMPVPRPGTQHHALGHGRVPSAQGYGQRSVSAMSASTSYRAGLGSGVGAGAGGVAKKASRARRESFKPRPSVDDVGAPGMGRWGGFPGMAVKEEEEGY